MHNATAPSSCDQLTQLPFELASQILSSESLDAASLIRGRQVCKRWKKLIDNDEIWHKAAYRWGYLPDLIRTVQDVKQSKLDENGYFAKVQSWKDLCIAQEALDMELGDGRHGKGMRYPMSYSFLTLLPALLTLFLF
jgi:F-box-like